MPQYLVLDGRLDWSAIQEATQRPVLFAGSTVEFWNDPHIAQHMLAAHLDPIHAAASRIPEAIDAAVGWMWAHLGLQPGDALLDLGCGPGLYCQRFAAHGLRVTGVDFSANSIQYARAHDPDSTYILQNYLTLDYASCFQAVTLIYGDFCVLDDQKRSRLLQVVHRALKPGGHFVFDVSTWAHHQPRSSGANWSVRPEGGFWKATPHLVLEQCFHYPEHDTTLEQFTVIEDDGTITVYRNWFHYYAPDTIRAVLEAHGFAVLGLYDDLARAPLTPETEWIGIVAQKTGRN